MVPSAPAQPSKPGPYVLNGSSWGADGWQQGQLDQQRRESQRRTQAPLSRTIATSLRRLSYVSIGTNSSAYDVSDPKGGFPSQRPREASNRRSVGELLGRLPDSNAIGQHGGVRHSIEGVGGNRQDTAVAQQRGIGARRHDQRPATAPMVHRHPPFDLGSARATTRPGLYFCWTENTGFSSSSPSLASVWVPQWRDLDAAQLSKCYGYSSVAKHDLPCINGRSSSDVAFLGNFGSPVGTASPLLSAPGPVKPYPVPSELRLPQRSQNSGSGTLRRPPTWHAPCGQLERIGSDARALVPEQRATHPSSRPTLPPSAAAGPFSAQEVSASSGPPVQLHPAKRLARIRPSTAQPLIHRGGMPMIRSDRPGTHETASPLHASQLRNSRTKLQLLLVPPSADKRHRSRKESTHSSPSASSTSTSTGVSAASPLATPIATSPPSSPDSGVPQWEGCVVRSIRAV
ncbi:hypothetical protein ACQY0O_003770 [Thecaphora frezii]